MERKDYLIKEGFGKQGDPGGKDDFYRRTFLGCRGVVGRGRAMFREGQSGQKGREC